MKNKLLKYLRSVKGLSLSIGFDQQVKQKAYIVTIHEDDDSYTSHKYYDLYFFRSHILEIYFSYLKNFRTQRILESR